MQGVISVTIASMSKEQWIKKAKILLTHFLTVYDIAGKRTRVEITDKKAAMIERLLQITIIGNPGEAKQLPAANNFGEILNSDKEETSEKQIVFILPSWSKMFDMVVTVCKHKSGKYCKISDNLKYCCAGDCPILHYDDGKPEEED